jgi:hypothetical protein
MTTDVPLVAVKAKAQESPSIKLKVLNIISRFAKGGRQVLKIYSAGIFAFGSTEYLGADAGASFFPATGRE